MPETVTLHVAYQGVRGRRVRHFDTQGKANAFYRRRIVKGQSPEFVDETAPEPEARDTFGCRLGSQAAQINAVMTDKPQTVAAIAEKTGLAVSRVRSHLKGFVKKSHFAETDEGVFIKPQNAT